MATLEVTEDLRVRQRKECLVRALSASDPRLLAHAGQPLVGARRRIAALPCSPILPAAREHICASPEETAEEAELPGTIGGRSQRSIRRQIERRVGLDRSELRPKRIQASVRPLLQIGQRRESLLLRGDRAQERPAIGHAEIMRRLAGVSQGGSRCISPGEGPVQAAVWASRRMPVSGAPWASSPSEGRTPKPLGDRWPS